MCGYSVISPLSFILPVFLEGNADTPVNIGVILKLTEKAVLVTAHKNISSEIHCPVVIDFVRDIGPQIRITVRGTAIDKERKNQVLLHELLGQTQGQQVAIFITGLHEERQCPLIGPVSHHVLQIILDTGRKFMADFPFISGEEAEFTVVYKGVGAGAILIGIIIANFYIPYPFANGTAQTGSINTQFGKNGLGRNKLHPAGALPIS